MATNGTLYVFVHGLAVGHESGNNVNIILPAVPGHVYRAGSWLTETDIAAGETVRLEGVIRGNKHLADCQFVIHLEGCELTTRGRGGAITLPRPKEILELLLTEEQVTLTKAVAGVKFTGGAPPKRVASVLVMVYDYADENHVFLNNHDWEPCPVAGAMSLHIISTSVGPEGRDHEIDTQNYLHKVIKNYPGLGFSKPVVRRAPNWNETTDPLYGDLKGLSVFGEYIVTPTQKLAFAQAELEGIPPRTVRIGRLGRMKQQGRPLGTLWQEPDPLNADPCDCGFMHLR